MKIDIHNYEALMLDYLDGILEEGLTREMEAFRSDLDLRRFSFWTVSGGAAITGPSGRSGIAPGTRWFWYTVENFSTNGSSG